MQGSGDTRAPPEPYLCFAPISVRRPPSSTALVRWARKNRNATNRVSGAGT
ncbi:hypothetical protein [Streptomyces sp. NPDC006459]|uniref:hypothetical protein n=1 Tax=Streptomyces sp. NPDC006459 TaxID=3154303 RepID=UPI0033B33A11